MRLGRDELRQLVTRQSVLLAIEEYRGCADREDFIARARSGQSRSYWLNHDGQRLPLKAIAGRALQISNRDRADYGAYLAQAADFAAVLGELGFVVVREIKK